MTRLRRAVRRAAVPGKFDDVCQACFHPHLFRCPWCDCRKRRHHHQHNNEE